jgi:phage N-6-adenine-methyltransferase
MNESTIKTLFSSETDLWATPQDFYDRLHSEFDFELDPCCNAENHKCWKYFTAEVDGLAQAWAPHTTFMNPPYRKPEHICKPNCKKKTCAKRGYHNDAYIPGTGDWIKKAYEEAQKGATVVALIPARTDTEFWHDYVMKAAEIRLVKGRLSFGDGTDSAPFPSAVVVFRKHDGDVPKISAMEN